LISSWNHSSRSCSNFGRVPGQSMLMRVKNLNYVLWFFGAYMIIQHWACCLGESRKAILPVCVTTRILAKGDWRTRYVTLGIVVSFQLTIHGEKESKFWWYYWKLRKARAVYPWGAEAATGEG
jgi:hypothetical protein